MLQDPDKLYEWSGEMQSLILSSFYWGYIVTHMPGGILAEKFGGKHLLGLGILSTALFTLITPLIAPLGPWYMVALRVIEGLGEVRHYKKKRLVWTLHKLSFAFHPFPSVKQLYFQSFQLYTFCRI